MMTKKIEDHPVLGEITEWTHRGSEQNVWRGGDVDEGGNCWHYCMTASPSRQCSIDGWFTPEQLRAIADYMEKHHAPSVSP